ncbi:tail tubular protein B [Vibrio phage JSF24]|uniref:Tail tubular protein B n=3 Tax=Chatterjeevirus ICP3 TaxID=2733612 RepID=A0A2D0YWW1_9CAUD|nr:tail tubular protein B [Vibrio phage JSF20]ASV43286.1 tail tubular protein B [Vibrio phage JSF24]ASV43334.1 tail tubular protein B [Vibrio phage JSF34]
MALISQSIKNLKGGISQQPDILRYSDQGSKQINGFSSEVEGLQKRPPSVHVKRLTDQFGLGQKPYCHIINRDEVERYAVFFTGSNIRVFDLFTGDEKTVNAPNGLSYVTSSNPRKDLRMVTVADYTFILNRNVSTAQGTTNTPSGLAPFGHFGLVVIRGGQYGRTYRVKVNGSVEASFETPLGDQVEHAKQIDIAYIIDQLAAGLINRGWAVTKGSGYFYFSKSGTVIINSLEVEDGYNGQLAWGIINDVQKTTQLPVYAPNNYIIRVSGDPTLNQDDYYVKFDASRNVWTECPAPNIKADYNKDTMPHVLIREADGTFTFKQADWTHRAAGDDDTNPYPSFIGNSINDIFFFRNRLGFLSGENVILSGSGNYFNFFPESVAVLTDTDPIDVAVSTNRISILKYAVPFSEELILWSDQAQFVLSSDGGLTPTTVRLDLTTEFEVTEQTRPFGIGRGVYFVSPRAKFSSVRRFYAVQDVTQVKNAEDISAHVPSYVENGVFKMSGSSTENFLTILTEGNEQRVYFYKFLYLQEQLVQQSWSHWDFGVNCRVLCCDMIGAVMHLVIDSPSGVLMEKIEFTQDTKDYPDEPYRLYVDRKIEYTFPEGSYNDDDFKTRVKLKDIYGSTPANGQYVFISLGGVTFTFDPPAGGWQVNDGLIEFDGDLRGTKFFVGEAYTFLYEFSKFLIKTTDTAGGVATEDIGRLQLRRAWVNYDKSGNFRVEVNNQGRTFTYNMTGNRLSTNELILGDESLDTGQFRYAVSGNATQVTVSLISDTPNPLSIIGGGWEGYYVRRSSGI